MRPHTRRLLFAWAMLIGLSIALAVTADVHSAAGLGAPSVAAVGLVALLKSRTILSDYLELRPHRGVLRGLLASIALTLAIVVGSVIAVPA